MLIHYFLPFRSKAINNLSQINCENAKFALKSQKKRLVKLYHLLFFGFIQIQLVWPDWCLNGEISHLKRRWRMVRVTRINWTTGRTLLMNLACVISRILLQNKPEQLIWVLDYISFFTGSNAIAARYCSISVALRACLYEARKLFFCFVFVFRLI